MRRYPSHVVAEVTVELPFEQAGNAAFRYLFGYITGQNRSRTSVAMTAPVVQSAGAGQKVAMTAPVIQHSTQEGGYAVAFVLPASMTEEAAPEPTDPVSRSARCRPAWRSWRDTRAVGRRTPTNAIAVVCFTRSRLRVSRPSGHRASPASIRRSSPGSCVVTKWSSTWTRTLGHRSRRSEDHSRCRTARRWHCQLRRKSRFITLTSTAAGCVQAAVGCRYRCV